MNYVVHDFKVWTAIQAFYVSWPLLNFYRVISVQDAHIIKGRKIDVKKALSKEEMKKAEAKGNFVPMSRPWRLC